MTAEPRPTAQGSWGKDRWGEQEVFRNYVYQLIYSRFYTRELKVKAGLHFLVLAFDFNLKWYLEHRTKMFWLPYENHGIIKPFSLKLRKIFWHPRSLCSLLLKKRYQKVNRTCSNHLQQHSSSLVMYYVNVYFHQNVVAVNTSTITCLCCSPPTSERM